MYPVRLTFNFLPFVAGRKCDGTKDIPNVMALASGGGRVKGNGRHIYSIIATRSTAMSDGVL